MNENYSNKLINETSPYLLQHAHNPVEWHLGAGGFAKSQTGEQSNIGKILVTPPAIGAM